VPQLRKFAREIGKSHTLALNLWKTGIYEARVIACLIDEPNSVTEAQMEKWVKDLNNWAICDAVCSRLFVRVPFIVDKAIEWAGREEEFVKRVGFVLMADLSMQWKDATDDLYMSFIPIIERESIDNRKFVRKAVNWALRQIGKRNLALNKIVIEASERIYRIDSKSARWIAANALRELKSDAIRKRLS
jgi:3-methyladenine DNA glycosylase AlkD